MSPQGKADLSRGFQATTAFLDSTGHCLLIAFAILDIASGFEGMIDEVNAVLGTKYTGEDAARLGAEISLLPWIPLFPLVGFLVNGFLYLISHSKLGGKDAPKGPHGSSGHGDGAGNVPGHGAATQAGHHAAQAGHGHGGHVHGGHEPIPFAAVHSLVGPVSCGLSFLFALLAIGSWWSETHGHEGLVATLWNWVPLGTNPTWFGAKALSIDVALRLDALSALMLFFVTFVGTLIHSFLPR